MNNLIVYLLKINSVKRAPQVNESEIIGARVNSSKDVAPRLEENAASRCY